MSLKRWNGSSWVTVAGSRPGPQGATGPTGPAATISVGTVTTVSAGTSASIVNGGTSSAAIFNFQIPAGPNWCSRSCRITRCGGTKRFLYFIQV